MCLHVEPPIPLSHGTANWQQGPSSQTRETIDLSIAALGVSVHVQLGLTGTLPRQLEELASGQQPVTFSSCLLDAGEADLVRDALRQGRRWACLSFRC
jgi:hypothetical protein